MALHIARPTIGLVRCADSCTRLENRWQFSNQEQQQCNAELFFQNRCKSQAFKLSVGKTGRRNEKQARDLKIGRNRPLLVSCESDAKIAHLTAEKECSAVLPIAMSGGPGAPPSLCAFFQHPQGRRSMLNTDALQKMEQLDNNIFRCHLPSVEWLNFRVAPVVDLRVTSSANTCLVELLACKFEGSPALAEQNKRFSARMRNELTWRSQPSGEQLLQSRVSMDVALEVFTLPFTLLPLSAVEIPGNAMLHAMLERLVPLFLDHLVDDYTQWASGGGGEGQESTQVLSSSGEGVVGAQVGSGKQTDNEVYSLNELQNLAGGKK